MSLQCEVQYENTEGGKEEKSENGYRGCFAVCTGQGNCGSIAIHCVLMVFGWCS